jgi:hypothetical protein
MGKDLKIDQNRTWDGTKNQSPTKTWDKNTKKPATRDPAEPETNKAGNRKLTKQASKLLEDTQCYNRAHQNPTTESIAQEREEFTLTASSVGAVIECSNCH